MMHGQRVYVKSSRYVGRVSSVEARMIDGSAVTRVQIVSERGSAARLWFNLDELEQLGEDETPPPADETDPASSATKPA